MDKRTLLYIIIASAVLFGVNWYFESQNQQNLKEWQAQSEARKAKKAVELEKEIQSKTASLSKLPIEKIDGKSWVKVKNNFLTLSWAEAMPETFGDLKKVFTLEGVNQPAIYTSKDLSPLLIGDLPDFGTFDVQLFDPESQKVTYATYVDGHFSIPENKLAEIKEQPFQDKPSIALVKIDDDYLPTAIYDPSIKRLLWLDEVPGLKYINVSRTAQSVKNGEKPLESFYVLENQYQQLVFSNYGGALAEINLPFQTESNEESAVKEVEFDRQMVQDDPQNARFPLHPYMTPDNVLHEEGKLGGYYPLIRRDLIAKPGKKSIRVHPKYYGMNLISEYPEVAELIYEVKSFTPTEIVFESKLPHRTITKTFSLEPENQGGPYAFNLDIKIEGETRGLWLTSGVPEVEWISGGPSPSLKYRVTKSGKSQVDNIDLPKDSLTITSTSPDWIGNSNGFLGIILDPLRQDESGLRAQFVSGTIVPSRLVEIDEQYNRFDAAKMPGYQVMLPLKSQGGTYNFRVFAGPFATKILKTVDQTYSDPATGYNPDYIAIQTFHGWFSFISAPFAKFLMILLSFFHAITGSWGFSIILLTVALRVMLYPFNAWSFKSSIKMQKIAPEIAAIQEKYKKDPKKAQMEVVNLYRERGINPLSGCFPMLLQMPFLIGMFDLLKSTFELRGASFIPGWIDNLAAPDVLFSWTYPLPFIGNEFHLLPIILGAVMFFQQRMMSPLPKDPKQWTDQQRQQRTMGTMMTVLFTVMFYHFPSGLNIYWLSSMLLSMGQQWWTAKQLNNAPTKKIAAKK